MRQSVKTLFDRSLRFSFILQKSLLAVAEDVGKWESRSDFQGGAAADENVRDYLVDAEGKKKQRRSDVHRAIYNTIENFPDEFCILSGGVVIVARNAEIDEKNRTLRLKSPSIINGSQTQGVIRDAIRDFEHADSEFPTVHVTFELIATEDEDIIARPR